MVDVREIYGLKQNGKFLNAELAKTEGLYGEELTIKYVELQEINGKQKLVLRFFETEHMLVLNRTNAIILAENYGEDTDNWMGRQLKLKQVKRVFQGKLVDAIEVEPVTQVEIDFTAAVEEENRKKKKAKG